MTHAPNFLDSRMPLRFWKKCVPEPNSGCWIWIAADHDEFGYGSFWLSPRMRLAHRACYEALVATVDCGLVLDHLCRTTCCVNPSHLEPVTQLVNIERGTGLSVQRSNQTHCKNGHLLSPDNLDSWHLERGGRACKQCRRDAANRRANNDRDAVRARARQLHRERRARLGIIIKPRSHAPQRSPQAQATAVSGVHRYRHHRRVVYQAHVRQAHPAGASRSV